MREKECFVVKNVFSKYKDIEGSNSAWAGTESYYPGMFCLVCQRFVFKDEAVSDGHGNLSLIEKKNCSANCQRKYDNLSFEEKESLRKNISNPSSKSSMTTEEREREREREREQIKQYLQKNNIHSITLQTNGELLIEYQNQETKTMSANTQQLQQIKTYLQSQSKQSISQQELKTEQSAKKNYLPWI